MLQKQSAPIGLAEPAEEKAPDDAEESENANILSSDLIEEIVGKNVDYANCDEITKKIRSVKQKKKFTETVNDAPRDSTFLKVTGILRHQKSSFDGNFLKRDKNYLCTQFPMFQFSKASQKADKPAPAPSPKSPPSIFEPDTSDKSRDDIPEGMMFEEHVIRDWGEIHSGSSCDSHFMILSSSRGVKCWTEKFATENIFFPELVPNTDNRSEVVR
ncbi:hypothetical protein RF11_04796 [Thelohanellus kitauei]|uniref:Uncharacterized protein n=1 Tax=Thelohanellus kitauei TaxID=669202 RepID=A0A0C2JTW3_THEKT|nr:hypothetical protein RF11_04796 [Thelohanellus kitauei]